MQRIIKEPYSPQRIGRGNEYVIGSIVASLFSRLTLLLLGRLF
jgi:hypothetical protein